MVAKFKRFKKIGSFKIIFFSVLLLALFLGGMGFLILSNIRISQSRTKMISRLEELKREIQILEERNKELKENFSQAQSKEYLEKVAREQLGLKAPGEEVVVITKEGEEKIEEEIPKTEKNFWNPETWWDWLKSKF